MSQTTEAQRQANTAAQRRRRAKLRAMGIPVCNVPRTPEQKQQRNAVDRLRYAKLTPEQKEALCAAVRRNQNRRQDEGQWRVSLHGLSRPRAWKGKVSRGIRSLLRNLSVDIETVSPEVLSTLEGVGEGLLTERQLASCDRLRTSHKRQDHFCTELFNHSSEFSSHSETPESICMAREAVFSQYPEVEMIDTVLGLAS